MSCKYFYGILLRDSNLSTAYLFMGCEYNSTKIIRSKIRRHEFPVVNTNLCNKWNTCKNFFPG